jgi:hypothetical protein
MSISLLLVRLTRGVSSGQADVGEALLSYLIVELKFLLAPDLFTSRRFQPQSHNNATQFFRLRRYCTSATGTPWGD